MKTIGLIGGMSWASSAEYYRLINEEVRHRLGGFRSAPLVLKSLDFEPLVQLQTAKDWQRATEALATAARDLEHAGAGCVLICANTLHKVAAEVQHAISVPLLHIADVTSAALRRAKIRKAGLVGTRVVMEQPFFIDHLIHGHAVDICVPKPADREKVQSIVMDELCQSIVREESRAVLTRIVDQFRRDGAHAVILACSELSLLFGQNDSVLPVFDTAELHAMAAVEWAFGEAV